MSLLLSLLLSVAPGHAQEERRMFGMPTHDFVFPTGFRIVIHPDDAAPVVGTTMVFEAGSADDPKDRTGLAHFVEHLWFRSYEGDHLPVFQQLDAIGCQFNATTTFDTTDYRTACPEEMFSQMMKLEGRRLRDMLTNVKESEVVIERDVVRNELRSGGHGHGANPFEMILATRYKNHGYGHLPGGSEEDVSKVTLADARAFTEAHYTPANATLVITGDVDPARALRIALKTLPPTAFHPDLTREQIKRTVPPGYEQADPKGWMWPVDPANPTQRLAMGTPSNRIDAYAKPAPVSFSGLPVIEADVDKSIVVASWTLPPFDPLETHFDERQLGWQATQWVNDLVPRKHIEGTGCSAMGLRESTLLVCEAQLTEKGDRDVVLSKMSRLTDGQARPRGDTVLSKFWVMLRRLSHLEALEPIATPGDGRNTLLAHHVHLGHSANYLQEVDIGHQSVSPSAAITYLIDHVDPEQVLWMQIEPAEDKEPEVGPPLGTPAYAIVETEIAKEAAARHDPAALHFDPARVASKRLPSGLTIIAVDHGSHPMVEASLYVPVGRASAPPGVDRLAEAVADWERGSGLAFQRTTQVSTRQTHSIRGFTGASSNYQDVLRDMRKGMDTLNISEGSMADPMRRATRSRRKNAEEPWYLAQRARSEGLGSWNSSLTSLSDEEFEFIRGLKPTDLRAHLRAKWRPSKAVLVVVGAADANAMLKAAETSFATWQGQPATPPSWSLSSIEPKARAVLFDSPKAHTARLSLSCTTPISHDADTTAMAADILRQHQMRALRTEGGLVYTPWANVSHGGRTANVAMSAEVSPERVVEAIELQRRILDRLATDGIDEADTDAARLRVQLSSPLAHQTRRGVRGSLAPRILDGWTLDDWYRTYDTLGDIKPEQLRSVFAGCTDNLRVSITGPTETYMDAVDAAMPGVEVQRFTPPEEDED